MVHYEVLEANANGVRFLQYLHGLQEALPMRQIEDPSIVMDNVGFHLMDMVLEEMIILGQDHHFLPPYSLSSILLRTCSLSGNMNNVRNVITVEEWNDYNHCQACLNGQDYFEY